MSVYTGGSAFLRDHSSLGTIPHQVSYMRRETHCRDKGSAPKIRACKGVMAQCPKEPSCLQAIGLNLIDKMRKIPKAEQ